MRNHIIDAITEKAKTDEKIMLVVADLGYSVVEKFQMLFPDRFINAGIAEQNMTAISAGLAMEGNTVFTYSIGNFPTLRCIEHIRDDVCYHKLNVKILAVGGGFAYGDMGMTHHATEDIAMMRALPNMRVYVPADTIEAVACLEDALENDGPAYIRMARGREPNVHPDSSLGTVRFLIPMQEENESNEVSIIAAGTILSESMKLSEMLKNAGINVSVFASPLVKPLDEKGISVLAKKSKLIVTMEDHNTIGGLGGAVSEVVSALSGERASVLRIGLQDTYTEVIGSQDYLREYYGISAKCVFDRITKMMGV